MHCHKSFTNFVAATLIALVSLASVGVATAAEQPAQPSQQLSDEPSLFERYRTGAKDLVLKGLELVGINYRRGGTNPDSGLDCSGFVQLVFKDAAGLLLPRTAREQS